jgi:hypothetical protein
MEGDPMVVKERGAEMLLCALDDDEVLHRGEDCARLDEEIEELEEERKAASRFAKEKIKTLLLQRKHLSSEVRARKAKREVAIELRLNFELRMAQTVRTDTEEVIRERPLTFEERQGRLDLYPDPPESQSGGAEGD